MKEKIYTIPVMDAFKENSECPLCTLYTLLEKNAIEFVMSPSYMERDVRAETDKLGFCGKHLIKMNASKNTLGLALMLQTHLMRRNKEMKKLYDSAKSERGSKKSLFGGSSEKNSNALSQLIYKENERCYVCNKADATYERYIDTVFQLWTSGDELKTFVKNGKGFCLTHFAFLLDESEKRLSSKEYLQFKQLIIDVQMNNIAKLEEDIDWFVKKFDYRFANEPWKDSKDSIQRAILKLSSANTEENDK